MLLAQLILAMLTSLGCPVNNCGDHFSIKGTLTDYDTNQPVQGVHVFIAGSQMGSDTDTNGQFEITEIDIEAFQLIFSHIGYQTRTINFDLRTSSKNLLVKLKPNATELETVVVSSIKNRRWNRNLKKFKSFFFGENFDDALISLENEYLIDFTDKRGQGLLVENAPGLEIKNDYLGYDIYYQLQKFELGDIKTYMGYPRFTEIEAVDTQQKQIWFDNRKTAYNGSMRHFFKSLLEKDLDGQGYGAALLPEFTMHEMNHKVIPKKDKLRLMDDGIYKKNIIVKKVSKNTYELQFKGKMEIAYFDEFDEYGDPQSSEILLNAPLLLNKNGVVLNPGALVSFGFWTKEGMYELLPFEYNPNQN